MAREVRERRLRIDGDGVRIHELSGVRGGVWFIVVAIVLAGAALLLLTTRPSERRSAERALMQSASSAPAASDQGAAGRPASHDPQPRRPAPAPRAAPALPAASTVADAEAAAPSRDDPMFGPVDPAVPSGVALFPPPGTKPIKRGLLVPEDFELPPGYVRHYQATDDGERVPAILMFHPDYRPLDQHGEPIALPADRVVPPEMAPPGLPIEVLELPENQVPPP